MLKLSKVAPLPFNTAVTSMVGEPVELHGQRIWAEGMVCNARVLGFMIQGHSKVKSYTLSGSTS